MKRAIVTICPGGRQTKLLRITLPSWQTYSKRMGIPIVVIEKPLIPEHHFWGKYFLLEMPELSDYDAILHLDNDVIINPASPSIFEEWNPDLVGVIDERSQQHLSEEDIIKYHSFYEIPPSDVPPGAKIYNMGVFLSNRSHLDYFRELYEAWKEFISHISEPPSSQRLKMIADQPHVSLALQRDRMAHEIDQRFNTLWWTWYQDEVTKDTKAFLLRAKIGSLLKGHLPMSFWRQLFSREKSLLDRALSQVHFLHVAGSKSPLLLFEWLNRSL